MKNLTDILLMYTLLNIIYIYIFFKIKCYCVWYIISSLIIYLKKFESITYDGRGCRIILYCIPLFHINVGVPLYYSYILSIQKEIY